MNMLTRRLQAVIIVSQLIGSEYCFSNKVPYIDLKTGETTQKSVSEIFELLLDDITSRLMTNPFIQMSSYFNEKELFAVDSRYFANCKSLRGLLQSAIEKKKQLNAKVDDATDIVSLLIHEESYKDDADIVDDLIVLFIAGSATIQNTTTNFISNMLSNPREHQRLL